MKNRRLVIVWDSDQDAVADLKVILTATDFEIHYFTRLQDIYDYLQENLVDVLLLDIQMVEENGTDVLNELEIRGEHAVKILTHRRRNLDMTAYIESDNIFAFAGKPYDAVEIRKLIHSAVRMRDLTREVEMLKSNGTKDSKSGLYNEPYFLERVNAEYKRAERYVYPLSLVILNIKTQMKSGMDTLSRSVSLQVSGYLKQLIRDNDILVQDHAGDYYLLLPDTPKKGTEILVMRILSGLDHEFAVGVLLPGQSFKAYAGFVSYPDDGFKNEQGLLQLARHALERAKREKRGSMFCFPGMDITGLDPMRVSY